MRAGIATKLTRRSAVFVLLLHAGASARAQQLTASQVAHIDTLANAAIANGVAGMTIAVAHGSGTAWIKGYGLADRQKNVTAKANTIYRIRSISKTFTSAVILQLASQGRIALDSPVTKYLADAPTRGRRITIRQLLSHTSGLPTYHGATWRAHYHERLPAARWVHLADSEPLAFEPGADYAYSNTGFDLLALVVERVTAESFPDYLRTHITGMIGLRDVSHCSEENPPANRATPYDLNKGKLVPADAWGDVEYGAAMMCSTAGDLITWSRALDRGAISGLPWINEMRTPATLNDGTRIGYGLGTGIGEIDGHRMVGHTGSGGGWASVLEEFPNDSLTIVVLTNTEAEPAPELLATSITRVVLDLPPRNALPTPPETAGYVGK